MRIKISVLALGVLSLVSIGFNLGFGSRAYAARVEVKEDGSTDQPPSESRRGPASADTQAVSEDSEKPGRSRSPYEKTEKGENEARKYFRKTASTSSKESVGSDDHYLALHIGGFLISDSYSWGVASHNSNLGRFTTGLTYRMSSLGQLADWFLRADFISYGLAEGGALQLGILPTIMFPDSGSRFPLYFGAGIGPGIFINQVPGSATVALDYQLLAGVRLFNVIENAGFLVETGLKNHFLLLSPGQFNGLFLSVGVIFTF